MQSSKTIPFTTYVQRPIGQGPEYSISVDQLWQDRKLQPQSLFEWIETETVTKLYFDFDGGDLERAFKFYMLVAEHLGVRWTLCGYYTNVKLESVILSLYNTISEEAYDNNWLTLEYINPETIKTPKTVKDISFHIVYDAIVDRNEMFNITRSIDRKCKIVDSSVYKGKGSRQLLRHPYYNKENIKCGLCSVEKEDVNEDVFKKSFVLNVEESFKVVSCDFMDELFKSELSDYYVKKPSHQSFVKPSEADINAESVTENVKTHHTQLKAKEPMSDELAKKFVEGINGFTIHGTSSPAIEDGASLFTLFTGINALPDKYIKMGYDNAYCKCERTGGAEIHFEASKKRYAGEHSLPNLVKIMKLHNKEYYNKYLEKLLQQRRNEMNSIKDDVEERQTEIQEWKFNVINDGFSFQSIRRKCPYANISDAVIDLKRVFVAIDSANEVFVLKGYADDDENSGTIQYVNEVSAKAKLNKIIVGEHLEGKSMKKISMWDVYLQNTLVFTMERLTFYSKCSGSFNIFQGYEYKQLDTVDEALIQPFLDHNHNIIADGNAEFSTHMLKWIASILQNPKCKTEVVPVLLGRPGSGKNWYTNVICKMMSKYADDNVSLSDILEQFNSVLENKKLLVLNEVRSLDSGRKVDNDKLKSLITDKRMKIEEKFAPRRTVDNVANFIMISNNRISINIDQHDRRYMVTETSSAKCGNTEYFEKLWALYDDHDFCENLFTYFMKMDLKGFNPRVIPHTVARETIQEACLSPYESFARDYYEQIVNIPGPQMWDAYKKFVEGKNYQLCTERFFTSSMKEFTGDSTQVWLLNGEIVKRTKANIERGAKNTKVYNLKPEYIAKFKEYHGDVDDGFDEEEDCPGVTN